ncbi:substrate-binding domain-containing protein [Conexibacter sp. CPCC 206217]|uniref:substrate-binding domain-containing protein n=1 Tax=Conexibacter sp. CPCC 206217 TaxID=3064574 RepID=UPI0027209045|nr:substrate-binding domain-containing protein [Conexibacter sp. CPCC 206217]MDO8213137.1 substrate-binding domain-containing protein [Conexibacter sp. CPCC 206217]
MKLPVVVAALAVLALVGAGCGSDGGATTAGAGADSSSAQAADTQAAQASAGPRGQCGDVPIGPLKDPGNLVAQLPEKLQKYYEGLPYQIDRSAYADFRPRHGPPWTIGFLNGPLEQPYNQGVKRDVEFLVGKLKEDGLVKDLVLRAAPSYDVAPQIQQFNSLIQQKVDVIIVEPNSTTALIPTITAAYKAGIPTITTSGVVTSPYAVNWTTNPWLNGAVPTAYVAKNYMRGTGNYLLVQGQATQPTAIAGLAGMKAALSNCPDIKVVNDTPLQSTYSNSVAKSVVLQFLASHPEEIDGVGDGGVTCPGIVSAFEQLGRRVPYVTNMGAIVGCLAYQKEHKDEWGSAATASGGYEFDRIPIDIALRVLQGKGPKLNSIIGQGYLVTNDNIDEIADFQKQDGFNSANVNVGEAFPYSLLSSEDLDGYFSRPGVRAPPGIDEGEAEGIEELLGQ